MASKTINTILNLKDNFSKTIKNTSQNTKQFQRQAKMLSNQVKKMKETLAKAFKPISVGVAAAGAAFVGMSKVVMDNADELQRQADITGLSAERLQELQYAGSNLGVELETITGAQSKLTKSMNAARKGTGAQAEAFKKLGIKVKDGNGQLRSAKDVMAEAFTALGKVGNETERDALAMQLFGKSAMELNPLIKAGGDELNRLSNEARKSGAVMSNEAVAGLDSLGDTLANIKSGIMGAFGESLAKLLPRIQELVNKIDMEKVKQGIQGFAEKVVGLLDYIINNGPTIISMLSGIAAGFVAWNVASMIQGVVKSIKAFKAANEGATIAQWALNAAQSANPVGIIIMLIAGLVTAIITLWNTNEDFRNGVIKVWNAIKTFFVTTFNNIKDKAVALWEGIKAAFAPVVAFFSGIWDGIKNGFRVLVNFVIAGINKWLEFLLTPLNLLIKAANLIPGVDIPEVSLKIPQIPEFALGTQYFKGGLARINERGGEVVNLPNGSKVIPADKSKKIAGQGVNVQVIIQGNVIGNEKYADYVGQRVADKVILALENM